MEALKAKACAVERRRVQRSKVSRSSAVKESGGIGRPMGIRQPPETPLPQLTSMLLILQ